ncbi:MAG: peptidoglycan DD-metalloendopeptidase family protein [Chloroflexota bacterium]
MKSKYYILFILVTFISLCFSQVQAQANNPPTGPIYIVSPGDSLLGIAAIFDVSLEEIMIANNIIDPNQLFPGDQLLIPGLDGINGILASRIVSFGETQRSLSRQYRIPIVQLRKLNHIISPTEFYAGAHLIIIQDPVKPTWTGTTNLESEETLLERSIKDNSDPWTIIEINNLADTWVAIPGDVLYIPSSTRNSSQTGLPSIFLSVIVDPLPLTQGKTAQIQVITSQEITLSGILVDKELHFFPIEKNSYVSLQGVHALTEPGLYPLRFDATLQDGSIQSFEQMILIQTGNYTSEILFVDPESINPSITAPEEDYVRSITSKANPERYFNGMFKSPAIQYEDTGYFTSKFGNRRTYKGIGSDLEIFGFHSGLDFGGGNGLPITAPASGIVVFTGLLDVRGNATIIDHGWGVYSGFWHQSEIKVSLGDFVETGQVIGLVGGTGRVTGAHLHWEVWVNGIQVDPMDWLENTYPHP